MSVHAGRRPVLTDVAALKKEGNAAFKRCDYEEAAACCTAAIDNWMSEAYRAVLYVNRATTRLKQSGDARATQALNDAQRAAQLDPMYAKAHFRQGQALRRLRRRSEAAEAFSAVGTG